MKYNELQQKSHDELVKLLGESRDELQKLRFQVANDQSKEVRKVRTVRQKISRILTVLNNQAS